MNLFGPVSGDGRGIVPRDKRKIIYCGTDVPSVDARGPGRLGPEDLANQKERLRQLPFDGIAVNIYDPKFPWPRTVLGNNLFSSAKQDLATFAGAVEGLKSLRAYPHLTDNFLLIATGYWFESGAKDKFDWFDDARWATVENNLRVYSQIARRAGTIKGFLLDIEEYRKPPSFGGEVEWAYNVFSQNHMYNLVNALPQSRDPAGDYKRRVRDRGRRFFRALDDNLPGVPILLYVGNGASLDIKNPFRPDLFPPFLDGILEEIARSRSRAYVIDGCEGAYKLRTGAEHKRLRETVKNDWKSPSTVPDLYDRYVRVGFGKWLDPGDGPAAWNTAEPSKNYYSLQGWQTALDAALDYSDEYVWVWSSGSARAFPMSHGRAPNVAAPYFDATRKAKRL